MVKTLLFGLFVSAAGAATAQIASVQSGNFNDAGTWDCSCVPTPTDDLTITHSVVFTGDLTIGDAVVQILPGGSLYGSGGAQLFPEDGSTIVNHGSMNMTGIQLSGQANFTNESTGYVYITGTIISSFSSSMQNAGSFTAYDLIQGGSFSNKGTASFDLIQCNGTLLNDEDGILSVDSLNVSQQFHNYGHGLFQQVVNPTGQVYSAGSMQVTEDMISSGELLLETTGTLTIWGAFISDGTLSILGEASCEAFTNSGELNGGGSGKICILDASANSGSVNGISVCDQTGNDFDTNTGSISANVLFCSNGNCAELGVGELSWNVSLAPNPASDNFSVSAAVEVKSVELYAISGAMLRSVAASEMTVGDVVPGVYLVGINGNTAGLHRLLIQ
jgi:hypothetical protein